MDNRKEPHRLISLANTVESPENQGLIHNSSTTSKLGSRKRRDVASMDCSYSNWHYDVDVVIVGRFRVGFYHSRAYGVLDD